MSVAQSSAQPLPSSNPIVIPQDIPCSISSSVSPALNSSSRSVSFFSFSVVPIGIWFMGSAMMFINISYVVIYSLSALYLSSIGTSSRWIGLLEGIVEAVSFLMKLFSGVISDYLRRRKSLMVTGYGMMVISKPFFAISISILSFSTFWFWIMYAAARCFERMGNGIQGTPRDAMVGDLAPSQHKGACFGLLRSLGVFGSILGGVMAICAMWWTGGHFQTVFWLTTIPATLSLLILIIAVKEPKHSIHPRDVKSKTGHHPLHWSDLSRLGKEYWALMGIVAVFMLSRVSETFIVLHAHYDFDLPVEWSPVIMLIYNITYCLSSYPVGRLSDRIGRYGLLVVMIVVLMLADLLIATASNLTMLFLGTLVWGIQMGIAQSIFLAAIADLVPEDLRGTGFGVYYLVGAAASVLAGLGAGSLAHTFGYSSIFLGSLVVAGLSLVVLSIFLAKKKKMMTKSLNSQ